MNSTSRPFVQLCGEGAVVMSIPLPAASPAGALIVASLLHDEILAEKLLLLVDPQHVISGALCMCGWVWLLLGLWMHFDALVSQ